jgi:hypothetical protein
MDFFMLREDLSTKLIDDFKKSSVGIERFLTMVFIYQYQIFPLLDTLETGREEISLFKSKLHSLVEKINDANGSAIPLTEALEALLLFCKENPVDALDEKTTERLMDLVHDIILNSDYKELISAFLPEEERDSYWKDAAKRNSLRVSAAKVLISYAYEKPNQLRADAYGIAFHMYKECRIACKDFLIVLAAINHTLLCRPGSDSANKSPSATAARYAEKDFFNLEREIR